MRRLTVIGTGYLGAVHAAYPAELGFMVLGTDIDQGRIAALNRGQAPVLRTRPGPAAPPWPAVGPIAVHRLAARGSPVWGRALPVRRHPAAERPSRG